MGRPPKMASSPLRLLTSFLVGAEMRDPCRGFASSPPAPTVASLHPGLKYVTPVEDSALRIKRSFSFHSLQGSESAPLSSVWYFAFSQCWFCYYHPAVCLACGGFRRHPCCTQRLFNLQRSSELHVYVFSSRHWAGELGIGRTGRSLDGTFPPQGGGSSPRQVDPMGGRKTERPLGKMVVVVVEYY